METLRYSFVNVDDYVANGTFADEWLHEHVGPHNDLEGYSSFDQDEEGTSSLIAEAKALFNADDGDVCFRNITKAPGPGYILWATDRFGYNVKKPYDLFVQFEDPMLAIQFKLASS